MGGGVPKREVKSYDCDGEAVDADGAGGCGDAACFFCNLWQLYLPWPNIKQKEQRWSWSHERPLLHWPFLLKKWQGGLVRRPSLSDEF